MDDIISILQNPHKMEQLILKLKTIGENSPQFQTFKTSIQSFQLNKPLKGVHQKHILQHVFKYSDSRECFDSFRLVCKSWQNAVETIRLDTCLPLTIFQELCLDERNGHFPLFYSKYLKLYKELHVRLNENFDMKKWNSISNLLLQNMTNLSNVSFYGKSLIPPKFVIFLFNLFENSQSTLKTLIINFWDEILLPPAISLPNLTKFSMCIYSKHEVNTFDYLMKTVYCVMYKDVELFEILYVHHSPKILQYITKKYPNHFVCGPEIFTLEHIPLKISHLQLPNAAAFKYGCCIEYLILRVKDLNAPSEGGWEDYKESLSFFPNLKGIIFYYDKQYTNLMFDLRNFPLAIQNIWHQRISYLKSKNFKILNQIEYLEVISKFRQSLSPSWSFRFVL